VEIEINGKNFDLERDEVSISELISEYYPVEVPFFAVALNESFISKSQYQSTQLKSGDRIEILSPNPGG
jgi:thiamine biosynthesis protein ThiS